MFVQRRFPPVLMIATGVVIVGCLGLAALWIIELRKDNDALQQNLRDLVRLRDQEKEQASNWMGNLESSVNAHNTEREALKAKLASTEQHRQTTQAILQQTEQSLSQLQQAHAELEKKHQEISEKLAQSNIQANDFKSRLETSESLRKLADEKNAILAKQATLDREAFGNLLLKIALFAPDWDYETVQRIPNAPPPEALPKVTNESPGLIRRFGNFFGF